MPRFNIADGAAKLITFIKNFCEKSGHLQLVVGLSGGVDSSLSAALGARAVGPENVLGMIMPYKSSSPDSAGHAEDLAKKIGIPTEKREISPMVDAYFGAEEISAVRRGNKCARERMSILFDIASRDQRLVLGTSNKTEICLGYATWYGDGASSLNPLGGLYKHEVRAMAEHLGVPQDIIKKNPTADLWPGQTDEGELGITYADADAVLMLLVEQGEHSLTKITAATGIDESIVRRIVERINRFAFKRALPGVELLGGYAIPERIELR